MLQLLVTALFGLLAGLLGSAAQAHFQSQAKEREIEEKRRETRREKAEKVFEELRLLVADYANQSTYALQSLVPVVDKPLAPRSPSAAMLDALVTIYFPRCLPIVEAFHAEMKQMYAGYAKELPDAAKKGPDAIKGIHIIMTQDGQQRALSFSDKLREAMKPEVEALWNRDPPGLIDRLASFRGRTTAAHAPASRQ